MRFYRVWSVIAAAYLEQVFWFKWEAEEAGLATEARYVVEPFTD